jgi:hypothetical protein
MRYLALVAVLAVWAAHSAAADGSMENKDLDLIPGSIDNGPAAPAAAASADVTRFHIDDAATGVALRGDLRVALPPQTQVHWQNRTSLDLWQQWRLTPDLTATLSDRFDVLAENDIDWLSHEVLHNDLREAYLSWDPLPQTYFEIGRINLRNGAALGWNPTDFFKTSSLVLQASLDPQVRRENRLGTVMLNAQKLFDAGSIGLAIAPGLTRASAISDGLPASFDPGFGRTNGTDRLLLSGNIDFGHDINPQFLLYHDGFGTTRLGANLSRNLGNNLVLYAEWAGGKGDALIARAEAFGRRTGTLPASTPDLLTGPGGAHFQNDISVGGSWTSAANVTINLEYHYHESGFSAQDWRNWFALGHRAPAAISSTLWYIREFAADQQEPLSRHEVFLRADWNDAFVRNLELSAFALVNADDGSTLTQLSAIYHLTDRWNVGAYLSGNFGAPRSEHGSVPQAESAILQLIRYF